MVGLLGVGIRCESVCRGMIHVHNNNNNNNTPTIKAYAIVSYLGGSLKTRKPYLSIPYYTILYRDESYVSRFLMTPPPSGHDIYEVRDKNHQ